MYVHFKLKPRVFISTERSNEGSPMIKNALVIIYYYFFFLYIYSIGLNTIIIILIAIA